MSYVPRMRLVRVPEGFRDPYDVLEEMFSPPPLLNEEELSIALAHAPPEDLLINMARTADGGYVPDHIVYTPTSRRRR